MITSASDITNCNLCADTQTSANTGQIWMPLQFDSMSAHPIMFMLYLLKALRKYI